MRDKGECAYGDKCRFSHDAKVVAQSKKLRPDKRGKILCKFIKDPSLGQCPQGDKCPYNHDPKSVKEKSQQDVGAVSNQDGDPSWEQPTGVRIGCCGVTSFAFDVSEEEYAGVCRAVQSHLAGIRRKGVESQPGRPGPAPAAGASLPQLSGWRAESSWRANPIATKEVANGSAEVAALKAEVAQLKAMRATSNEIEELKTEVAQLKGVLATLVVSLSPQLVAAQKEDPYENDPRWSLRNEWRRKQCTAEGSAGIADSEVCTAEDSAGIVKSEWSVFTSRKTRRRRRKSERLAKEPKNGRHCDKEPAT